MLNFDGKRSFFLEICCSELQEKNSLCKAAGFMKLDKIDLTRKLLYKCRGPAIASSLVFNITVIFCRTEKEVFVRDLFKILMRWV